MYKNEQLKPTKITELFNNVNFVVPIYQRNYAWGEVQIEQLIEDISNNNNKNYFLGTLIVNKNGDKLEVIDGQQRLTTLFLLLKALSFNILDTSLRFEARERSNYALANINKDSYDPDLGSSTIKIGWDIINQYIKSNKDNFLNNFKDKLENAQIFQVQVPEKIDLNHYFEIMNTRGEQLESHEVIKGKLLEKLSSNERFVAAKIWEACSDLSSYVQMNFDKKIRDLIFSGDLDGLNSDLFSFDHIVKKITDEEQELFETKSLIDRLQHNTLNNTLIKILSKSEEDNERFESAISFPNFLLQVNAVIPQVNKDTENTDDSLDDKKLIETLKIHYENADKAKNFIFNLLKYRMIFDKYVIKREFTANLKDVGKWSLKNIKKYANSNKYDNTFDKSDEHMQLLTLQSCLRITYTSPKTMHWITEVLKSDVSTAENITTKLENYCRSKIKESEFINEDGEINKTGFEIERIIFTYLDYLLYRDRKVVLPKNWYFQFRNSIEHFYPQNPTEGNKKWIDENGKDDQNLHSFGNLALITVSGNSRFSNLIPSAKRSSYPETLNQSLKLISMASMMGDQEWDKELVCKHEKAMIEILKEDLELPS